MSSFLGLLKELPNISIDRFDKENLKSSAFFLSHCHTDHMIGLNSCEFENLLRHKDFKLYCSPISKLILSNSYLSTFKDQIIEMCNCQIIEIPSTVNNSIKYSVTVSCIPAGHCPGSVMFLFETRNIRILYTGDFRLSLGDIKKFKQLHYDGHVKTLDNLYFDATFFNPERYYHFPLRSQVINNLSKTIADWLMKSEQHHVILNTSAKYGAEAVIIDLFKSLQFSLHIADDVLKIFQCVPVIKNCISNDCSKSRIHVHNQGTLIGCNIHLKNPCEVLKIRVSAMWYQSSNQNKMSASDGIQKFKWNEYKMCYATHCSYSELIEFLNYLQPKKLYPCTGAYALSDEQRDLILNKMLISWQKGKTPIKINKNKPTKRQTQLKLSKLGKIIFEEDGEHFGRETRLNLQDMSLVAPSPF